MKTGVFLILIIWILLVSCTNKRSSQDENLVAIKQYPYKINIIDGLQNPAEIKLSSIADSIRYIVLSKEKDVVINTFVYFEMTDNDFFIDSPKGILRFNRTGKFLNRIGLVGRGPGEYMQGNSFTLNAESKFVYVYRNSNKDLLTFDFSGNYKRKIPFTDSLDFTTFEYLSNSRFAILPKYIGILPDKMILCGIFDLDGNLLFGINHPANNSPDKLKGILTMIGLGNRATFINNEMVSNCDFEDTVYKINIDTIYPAYILNWGKLPRPRTYEEKYNIKSYYLSYYQKKYATIWDKFFETPMNAYFILENQTDYYLIEYDKYTSTTKSMFNPNKDDIGFINDIDGGIRFFPRWTNRAGNIWVEKINAIDFKNKHDPELLLNSSVVSPEMNERLKTFVDNLEIDDNPVLKIVFLKKF